VTEQVAHKPVTDVVLVGAGIMSATLGSLLRQLEPTLSIQIFERLDRAATESSDAWNNAGTGHAAFCELNYTPEADDGTVDVSKAIRICEQFEVSKQFWAALVERGVLPEPRTFIRNIPHMSFVWGEANVNYLRARYQALQNSPLFEGMEYSQDPDRIASWIPLVMAGRDRSEALAATRMAIGNDVNFGSLTRSLISELSAQPEVSLHLDHEVRDFRHKDDGIWRIKVHDMAADESRIVRARFVFIGAGGGSLPLLERTAIPEAAGYGGFPVSGQWLRCTNRDVIARHAAKVYGKAAVGAPPMSVPHLDSRHIGGNKELLFGPYAGFSTKFLKHGRVTDLFRSLSFNNIVPMVSAGIDNFDLTRYLVGQALLSPERRVEMLRQYLPAAESEDWELEIAGQRVQIIKHDGQGGGILQFGTEVVTSADGSMAALLGASPGASTAISIMLDLLERCFPKRFQSAEWQQALRALIPSLGRNLHDDPELCRSVRARSLSRLGLEV
jgi:malate dehydrogenase (quinone)